MKALILNSGVGSRMGDKTKDKPKCMTGIAPEDTIISRQLKELKKVGIVEVVITTGPFEDILKSYIDGLNLELDITYVHNPRYKETNYIYSIFRAKELLNDDILLLHGDLVFTEDVLKRLLNSNSSAVIVDMSAPLPDKDFKAVVVENKVMAIGIEYWENAVACQPLYYLLRKDWEKWLTEIETFCQNEVITCYAEKALNKIMDKIYLKPVDTEGKLCCEIDCEEDLKRVKEQIAID